MVSAASSPNRKEDLSPLVVAVAVESPVVAAAPSPAFLGGGGVTDDPSPFDGGVTVGAQTLAESLQV